MPNPVIKSAVVNSAVVNCRVFTGEELLLEHAVIIKNELIASVVPKQLVPSDITTQYDLQGETLVPGFVDLQVNGGGGVLFNDNPSVEGIRAIGEAHRQFGTVGFMPTLITDSLTVMRQAIRATDQAIESGVPGVLGIHLEGPFLNSQHKGAHNEKQFRIIDDEAIEIMTSLSLGKTIVTIAPELTTPERISSLVESGIIVCVGHSAANHMQTLSALAAGVRGFTHLFNAMTPMQSREPGIVGTALQSTDSWFGIIADGHHVHPATFHVAVSAKQKGGAILVTDAMPTVGSSDDAFVLNGETIHSEDGRCMNAAGSLAGSDLNMISAVNNAAQFAQLDWFEAVRMASLYPATAIGIDARYGRIAPGYAANMVAVDAQHNVMSTWVNGVCF